MIRLACMGCDRGDYDGTTIEKALHDGWEDISEEQTPRKRARNTNFPDAARFRKKFCAANPAATPPVSNSACPVLGSLTTKSMG